MPRLNKPAKSELIKNTREGENRSAIVKTAKTNVPQMNPNWMALVICAKNAGSRCNSLMISVMTEFPANQRDVHRNWASTMTGRMILIML